MEKNQSVSKQSSNFEKNNPPLISIVRPIGLEAMQEIFIRTQIRNALNNMPSFIESNDTDYSIEDNQRELFKDATDIDATEFLSSDLNAEQWASQFPFQLAQKRGTVPPDDNKQFLYINVDNFKSKFTDSTEVTVPYHVVVNIPYYAKSARSIKEVIEVFEHTGFGPDRETSRKKAADLLAFIIGINMMESLDPELNTKIQDKLCEPVNTKCEVHRFGFFWRPRWQNKEGKEIPFEMVRNKYLAIKQKNPRLATAILKKLEKTTIKMVPYREIREVLKQHFYTSKMAEIFHALTPNIPVYLGLFDPDMISASSVFDTYTDLITSYKESHFGHFPIILSTGYKVPHLDINRHDSPLYSFAVELDMAVRNATARHVKNGIYYPEPNLLILFNANSMQESFLEGASLEQPKEYSDSYESPIFIADLIQKRNLVLKDQFIFDDSNPILTTMPDRMQYELGSKEDKKKIFHGHFSAQHQIIRWRINDLRYLIETAQSHASSKAWAGRLFRSLPLNINEKTLFIVNNSKKSQFNFKDLRKPLEKALKVFFEQLHPLSMLNLDEKAPTPEIRRFSEILTNYFSTLPSFLLDEANYDKICKRGSELILQLLKIRANEQEAELNTWKNEDIQALIILILGEEIADSFIRAGFTAAKELAHLYKNKLNTRYSELTQHFLNSFYEECSQKTSQQYALDLPFTETQEAILTSQYDPVNPQFTKEQLLEKGKFNMNGLHIAALIGDFKLVTYALQHVPASWEADGHILPLHCAILYLINNGVSEINGNDLPLITSLASDETRFVQTDMGLTALGLALTRLENAGSVVKQCMLGWDVPNFVPEQIEKMARLASLKERQTPLLAIMNKLGKELRSQKFDYFPRSLAELEKHGFSFLEPGIIENRILINIENDKEITELEEISTTTLAEAVRQDNLGSFRFIQKAYEEANIKVTIDQVDRDGRPLPISAVVNTKNPSTWLNRLKELGFSLAVSDDNDDSPILHEAIFPASSRRMGALLNKCCR